MLGIRQNVHVHHNGYDPLWPVLIWHEPPWSSLREYWQWTAEVSGWRDRLWSFWEVVRNLPLGRWMDADRTWWADRKTSMTWGHRGADGGRGRGHCQKRYCGRTRQDRAGHGCWRHRRAGSEGDPLLLVLWTPCPDSWSCGASIGSGAHCWSRCSGRHVWLAT